jgi:hypothetical protein
LGNINVIKKNFETRYGTFKNLPLAKAREAKKCLNDLEKLEGVLRRGFNARLKPIYDKKKGIYYNIQEGMIR